jgi:hypothetical protein
VREEGAEENTLILREGKLPKAGEDCKMRSLVACTLHQICKGDQIKEVVMGGG